MSMKMVCNRCNKVKEDGERFNRIQYVCSEPELLSEAYDLCPECSKLFSIFMDGGEVEEDRYKDSKPSAVVIHKLANGNYAIENAPKPKKNGLHCATCAYQWDPDKCPRVKETPGTISCENDAEACNKWSAFREDKIDKEESDLSVETHTNAAGVTVPDSEPWRSFENRCSNCAYEYRKNDVEPCKSCIYYNNWKPKKDKTDKAERCFG